MNEKQKHKIEVLAYAQQLFLILDGGIKKYSLRQIADKVNKKFDTNYKKQTIDYWSKTPDDNGLTWHNILDDALKYDTNPKPPQPTPEQIKNEITKKTRSEAIEDEKMIYRADFFNSIKKLCKNTAEIINGNILEITKEYMKNAKMLKKLDKIDGDFVMKTFQLANASIEKYLIDEKQLQSIVPELKLNFFTKGKINEQI